MKNKARSQALRIFVLIVMLWTAISTDMNAEAARTSIKVGVNYNLPPFQFLDKDGNISGLHIDIMNDIAEREDLIIEYVPFNESIKAAEALKEGTIDVILGVPAHNNPGIGFRITNNITSSTLCMLVHNEDIGKVVQTGKASQRYTAAFELNTLNLSQLSQMNSMSIVIMGNQVQLYNALKRGTVDAVIGVKDSMIYMLNQNDGNNKFTIVHNYIESINYSILVRENDRALYNSLNRGINRLRASDTYERLLSRWISDAELEAARELSKKMLIFVIASVVAIVVITYTNRGLKKIVAEKTGEIRKRVQQLENESVLRERLIEFFPSGIMLLKEDGSVVMMNSVIRDLAGMAEKDKENTDFNISGLNVLGELWKRAESGKTTMAERPLVLKLGEGEKRIFRYRCQNINMENDKVVTVEDITREEAEKQEIFELRKRKALDRIVAGMAHEIKNPLMSINTFASLIRKQGNDEEFQELFARHVPAEVERINRLINMLINYTRPIRRNKEKVLISELIDDSICFAQISAKDKKLIKFEKKDLLQAYIYVNRDQVRQSLINLLLNSIQSVEEKLKGNEKKFAEGLVISVSGYCLRGKICIEVYDEGRGMTESEIERCTEPFFTTKKTGLGMGLALTNQFIAENSGRLEFESCKNKYMIIRMLFEEDGTNETVCIDSR